MIITSDNVSMTSSRNYSRKTQFSRSALEWTVRNNGLVCRVDAYKSQDSYEEKRSYTGSDNYNDLARLSYSQKKADDLNSTLKNSGIGSHLTFGGNVADNPEAELKTFRQTYINLLNMLREASFKRLFTGSRMFHQFSGDSYNTTSVLSLTSSASPTVWNRVEQTSYFMEEKETTAFESTGSVVTADGRTIDFNISFEMSRSFTESCEYAQFSQYEQILTDPLVINLENSPTTVTDKKFFFDLDCDGKKEEISQLSGGNGYLALDLNGDGIINDGRELFGTTSGNGFADLAGYDLDGNGWIDENDDIFSHLKVWTKDEEGKDRLLSLSEADVGAICLKSSNTGFSLKNSDGSLNGMVRASGIYLTESGNVKTLQQVDF